MDLGALFNPQSQQGPGQDTWGQLMQDPRGPAALLSIAGALAQPPQFGQSGFGHLFSALGSGGESVRTNEALDTKAQEAASKTDLRTSQALLAESKANEAGSKAGQAGANATIQQQRLELQKQANDDKNSRNTLGNIIRFQKMYQDHVKGLQTLNSRNALLGNPAVPVPSFKDWAAQSPQISATLGLTGQDVGAADSGGTPGVDETLGGVPISASTPQADPNEGRTATGPGGKKMIYRNGKWQDL